MHVLKLLTVYTITEPQTHTHTEPTSAVTHSSGSSGWPDTGRTPAPTGTGSWPAPLDQETQQDDMMMKRRRTVLNGNHSGSGPVYKKKTRD